MMFIQTFCDRSYLTKDTVRHYESIGLLEPKSIAAGTRRYRTYDEAHLERVELIKIGTQSGMTLREIKPLLDDLMAGKFSLEEQRQIVRDQLVRIDERIRELKNAKKKLSLQFGRIDEREAV